MASLFRAGYAIRDQQATHFLTMTVIDWLEIFIRPEFAHIVIQNLAFCSKHKGLDIHGWCLMPNHLHMICTQREGRLSDVLRDFKGYTAKQILAALKAQAGPESRRKLLLDRFTFAGARTGQEVRFWQEGNHPLWIETEPFYEQKLSYIHENPVKAGLVWLAEHYRYSSAIDYAGGAGLLPLVRL